MPVWSLIITRQPLTKLLQGPRTHHPLAAALWPSLLHALPSGGPALHLAATHAIACACNAQPALCAKLLAAQVAPDPNRLGVGRFQLRFPSFENKINMFYRN
eukprot:4791517-Pyramimonas_sp.AAC.2